MHARVQSSVSSGGTRSASDPADMFSVPLRGRQRPLPPSKLAKSAGPPTPAPSQPLLRDPRSAIPLRSSR